MANSKVDLGEQFKKSGMTLITDIASERLLKLAKKKKYEIPEDRFSRPCGGQNGFDDFVERFDEGA